MNNIFKILLPLLFVSTPTFSLEKVWIVTGEDVSQELLSTFEGIAPTNQKGVLETDIEMLPLFSSVIHDKFHRCGGFFAAFSKEEALEIIDDYQRFSSLTESMVSNNYTVNRQNEVRAMLSEVDDLRVQTTIEELSTFKNRYYKSKHGKESSLFLRDKWRGLTSGRNDVEVITYEHARFAQPSIIVRLKGESSEEIIVGGHADSIARSFWEGAKRSRAPGADDNASGIASITEAIRVLQLMNYKPKNTITFMAYAAEEVGLVGSKEIAKRYKREGRKVKGVLQLDMTNFKGSNNVDISLITDNTNQAQNAFLGAIIDEYVQLPWGRSACGYGCSDHASWHLQGFPASFPFEAHSDDRNRKIHTKHDTLANSGGTAKHAAKFSKIALAFILELDK